MQKEFRTRCCPICLEDYDYGEGIPAVSTDALSHIDEGNESKSTDGKTANALVTKADSFSSTGSGRKGCLDEYGIPRRGADGKKIKLLRCGHIFCETCWKSWVHSSACGSPCNCPVCRQDVGKSLCRSRRSSQSSSPDESDGAHGPRTTTAANGDQTSGLADDNTRRSYGSLDGNVRRIETASSNRIIRVSTILRGGVLFRQPLARRFSDLTTQPHQPSTSTDVENAPLLPGSRSCNATASG
jgi:Zinc finger, C3HC4 type (RING finger)